MPTLNQFKQKSTKYGLLAGKVLGILIIVFVLFKVGLAIKETIWPTPLPQPEAAFGDLPRYNFPSSRDSSSFNYTIDTLSGNLPVFSDRESVYKIEQPAPNLLDLEEVQKTVGEIGFNQNQTLESENNYSWQDGKGGKITINFVTKNFNYSSNYFSNPQSLNIDNPQAAIEASDNFLSSLFMPLDLDSSKTQTTLFAISHNSLLPVQSIANANVIEVTYFQKKVNNREIFYAQGGSSSMMFYVIKDNQNLKVVAANFFHQKISDSSSTYQIITADEAFGLLKEGKAYLASYDGVDKNILIKNVLVGYYMPSDAQEYLEPIIVFEGNNNFLAYVPAIKDEFLNK